MGSGCSSSNSAGATNGNMAKVGRKKKKTYLTQICDEHEDSVNCMGLSEDNSILVTGSEDCTARLWSTRTPTVDCLGVLQGHDSYIICITVEDNFVLTGSADKTIRKWDISTCECCLIFSGHTSLVNRVLCTGDFVFSSSYDRSARCWDFDTGICLRVFRGHALGVYPLIFIPADEDNDADDYENNQDFVVTGSADKSAKLWAFETARCIRTFKGHDGPIMCMGTDTTGRTLFTGSSDTTVRSWNLIKGDELQVFKGHQSGIVCMQILGKLMYTGSSDHTGRAWVTEFGDCTRVYKGHNHSVTSLKCYHGLVITGCGDAIVRVFDMKSGILKLQLTGHDECVSCLQVVEKRLFSGSYDGTLRVWDASGMNEETSLQEESEAEQALKAADGKSKQQEKEIQKLSGALSGGSAPNNTLVNGENTTIIMDNNENIGLNASDMTEGELDEEVLNAYNQGR